MNYVIYETARKLRDAGFPQPKEFFGQVWYFFDEMGKYSVGLVRDIFDPIDQFIDPKREFPDGSIFAPTAADILRELDVSEWSIRKDFDGFTCWDNESFSAHETHENPAEAAAACYLKRKGF